MKTCPKCGCEIDDMAEVFPGCMADPMNPVLFSADWESSCDHCRYQEEGGHYCLLHSIQVKNMDVLKCKDWEERLAVPPDGSASFDIYFPGEIGAGLHSFTDEVTVACKSGQWGGAPGEFEEYMRECLKEWYDGATVTLDKPL